MKLNLLLIGLITFNLSFAQTTILDFEGAATSTTYQYFGSSLEGTLNNIIANPDESGINTSATVADHVKPAGAQTWAGAFANPALQTAADMATNSQICIKVWFNQPGNVALKLENSTTGGPNWINTQTVSDANQWVELCYSAISPSIEDPFLPASGHIYEGVVLFFDFGESPTDDRTYYWDDLVLMQGGGATEGDITFSVDMNDYPNAYTTVYVSGSFNGWAGDANALEDGDGDGVWTGTVADIPVGQHDFKFTVDNWADQEQFSPFTPCVVVDPSGQFVNRRLVVSGDATLPTHCFNSCFACGDAVNITFEVGSGNIVVDPSGLYVAGGGNFGNPGDYPMSDDDMDGVWTITVERQKGFESFFTFTNGACPDWTCKEDILGQDCANPDNFNDRWLPAVTQDTTIATCFAECTTSTMSCQGTTAPANVTFKVDMNDYTEPFTTAYISGSLNGWAGDANPLDDADGDGIYQTTLSLAAGTYEYKFTLDNWSVDEQFADGDPCTVTDPSGQFVNRVITVEEDMEVCFEWNTCTECESTSVKDLSVDHSIFTLVPTVTESFATLNFSEYLNTEKQVRLFNANGVLISEIALDSNVFQHNIDMSTLASGLYFVNVVTGNKLATQKLIRK